MDEDGKKFLAMSAEEKLASMELNLQIAMHIRCCAGYLYARRYALIPACAKRAEEEGTDPDDVVAGFVKRYHDAIHGV